MARPSMSANVTSKHLTKAEKEKKLSVESKLKGSGTLKPPDYLSIEQKKIFRFIVRSLEESDILASTDVYVLSECSICIDRMRAIESEINANTELLENSSLIAVKDRYTKAFLRYCNELCLSPQSRAKIGNLALQAKDENPLMELLND